MLRRWLPGSSWELQGLRSPSPQWAEGQGQDGLWTNNGSFMGLDFTWAQQLATSFCSRPMGLPTPLWPTLLVFIHSSPAHEGLGL
jgi:hypothetical protein